MEIQWVVQPNYKEKPSKHKHYHIDFFFGSQCLNSNLTYIMHNPYQLS